MNLYDIKKPLTQMSQEEVVLFIRELRFNRTLDTSPPKKERVKREKKDPLMALLESPEQLEMFLSLLEKEKERCLQTSLSV